MHYTCKMLKYITDSDGHMNGKPWTEEEGLFH